MKLPEKEYNRIVNEALELRIRWRMTKQLMSHTPERVDCMNFFAAPFFSTILTSMNHSITASVAKLLDERKDVISLSKLLKTLKKDLRSKEDHQKFAKIEDIFNQLKKTAEPIIKRRHEIIGHISKIEVPTKVLVRDIDTFEKKLEALISEIASLFEFEQGGFGATWDFWYNSEIKKHGDADALMTYLEASPEWLNHVREKKQREAYMSSLRDSGS